MNRFKIINRIGDRYHSGNIENGGFSYAQAANIYNIVMNNTK